MQREGRHTSELKTSPTVIGPDGNIMTVHDLPPRATKRWVIHRKAQVVLGVKAGLITLKDACDRYGLTPEEFASWKKMIKRHGILGLRITRLTYYRKSDKARLSGDSEA